MKILINLQKILKVNFLLILLCIISACGQKPPKPSVDELYIGRLSTGYADIYYKHQEQTVFFMFKNLYDFKMIGLTIIIEQERLAGIVETQYTIGKLESGEKFVFDSSLLYDATGKVYIKYYFSNDEPERQFYEGGGSITLHR